MANSLAPSDPAADPADAPFSGRYVFVDALRGWYLLQTLAGIAVFYGFAGGQMGHVSPSALAVGCILGYLGQVALATAWMSRFRFGPAEWLWRSLTYGDPQPMRRS